MKYVLSKQCSFNRNKDSLIGYTNLSFRNGVWVPQYHLNVDDSLNSAYEDKMQAFCKYIKDVIVSDLNSTDRTKEIVDKMSTDYECVRITNWKECKDIIDNINDIDKI